MGDGGARKPIQLLTFLGTGDYKPATYQLDGRPHSQPEQYVQAALLELLQQRSTPDDPSSEVERLTICLTDAARAKHWLPTKDNGGGLERRIARHVEAHHLPRQIVPLEGFPTGQDEDELWVMFQRLSQAISPDHDLIVDVTHGFRLFPIVLTIALAFLRQVKGITIRHIYYGAWEAKDEKTKIAPIFDLTPMLELLDWSAAMQQLVQTGNAGALAGLITDRQTLPEVRDYAQAVAELADALNAGAMDEMVRRTGVAGARYPAVASALDTYENTSSESISDPAGGDYSGAGKTAFDPSLAPSMLALRPIHKRYGKLVEGAQSEVQPPSADSEPLPAYSERLSSMTVDEVKALLHQQINAAGLMFEHNQLQTGYTILSEVAISIVTFLYGASPDERKTIGGRLGNISHDTGIARKYASRVRQCHEDIGKLRNPYNHGWNGHSFTDTSEHRQKGLLKMQEIRQLVDDIPAPPSRPTDRRMLVVMNHDLLPCQEAEARAKLGVHWIVYPSQETQDRLAEIPSEIPLYEVRISGRTKPNGPTIKLDTHPIFSDVRKELEKLVRRGDCALIHGEPGLVVYLVSNLTKKGVTCYHATTRRVVHEEVDAGGKVTKTSTFEHVMFREYRL